MSRYSNTLAYDVTCIGFYKTCNNLRLSKHLSSSGAFVYASTNSNVPLLRLCPCLGDIRAKRRPPTKHSYVACVSVSLLKRYSPASLKRQRKQFVSKHAANTSLDATSSTPCIRDGNTCKTRSQANTTALSGPLKQTCKNDTMYLVLVKNYCWKE